LQGSTFKAQTGKYTHLDIFTLKLTVEGCSGQRYVAIFLYEKSL
jgi:hypothetical protein